MSSIYRRPTIAINGIIFIHVRGSFDKNRSAVVNLIEVGDRIIVESEPGNKYDRDAIKVFVIKPELEISSMRVNSQSAGNMLTGQHPRFIGAVCPDGDHAYNIGYIPKEFTGAVRKMEEEVNGLTFVVSRILHTNENNKPLIDISPATLDSEGNAVPVRTNVLSEYITSRIEERSAEPETPSST
jgi:hypothetical protein